MGSRKLASGYKQVNGTTYFTRAIENYQSFSKLRPRYVSLAQENWVDQRIEDRILFKFRKYRDREDCLKHLKHIANNNWLDVGTFLHIAGYIPDEFNGLCNEFDSNGIKYGELMTEAMSLTDSSDCMVSVDLAKAVEFWESDDIRKTIDSLWDDFNRQC